MGQRLEGEASKLGQASHATKLEILIMTKHSFNSRFLSGAVLAGVLLLLAACGQTQTEAPATPPNIVWVMLDELGYFEPSYMGNELLKTPNMDRIAAEGIRFTNALAGAPTCAPTRSVLMTGQHLGHTTVRRNPGWVPLRADDVTIAQVLKKAGYATGGFGKWGVGDRGTTGVPEKHGFDIFFGYYHQVHAHTFYPNYLLRNSEKIPLAGNTGDFQKGETFSQYLIYEETLKFIRENKDRPFYCYVAWTPPHGQWGIPDDEPSWQIYRGANWDAPNQRGERDAQKYAAMVHMADRQIGDILALLDELGLAQNTLVAVTGDNGGGPYFLDEKYPEGFFRPNGGVYRGFKGSVYEGGLRVPAVVRWPGKIEPGQVSDHVWYFADVFPTITELTGAETPDNLDGISMAPTLLGTEAAGRAQEAHRYLYWEYMGGTAVRADDWKIVQPVKRDRPEDWTPKWELYNLADDPGEKNDLSEQHPEIVERLAAYAAEAHTDVVEGEYLPGGKELGFQNHAAK
jgi:arylsulfatase A-like enzyme